MTTNYKRGYAFERKCKIDLEKKGYFVIRSGGSKGVADLVAMKGKDVLLIQCKRDGKLSREEWNDLVTASVKVEGTPIVAEPVRGGIIYWELFEHNDGSLENQPMLEYET